MTTKWGFCWICLLSLLCTDVACTHVTNIYVQITTDDTSCNGESIYGCQSGYKQIAGGTKRTCGFGGILTGYPLVCAGIQIWNHILNNLQHLWFQF